MRLYLRLIPSLQPDDISPRAVEAVRSCLTSITEVRSVDSVEEHPRGGLAIELQVEEGSVEVVCRRLESRGYRVVL
jgi:hypothetical protein